MATGSGSFHRITTGGTATVAALACACLPALAEPPAYSLRASGYIPDLSRHLRLSEGVRGARVEYFGQVMTGGQHCEKNAKGLEECISWDGFASAFEVEYEGVTETDERYAVAVAAPILSEGDVLGCVLFAAARGGAPAGETERKLAQAVAGFLGKQMES